MGVMLLDVGVMLLDVGVMLSDVGVLFFFATFSSSASSAKWAYGRHSPPPLWQNKNPSLGAPASLPARKRVGLIITPMGLDSGHTSSPDRNTVYRTHGLDVWAPCCIRGRDVFPQNTLRCNYFRKMGVWASKPTPPLAKTKIPTWERRLPSRLCLPWPWTLDLGPWTPFCDAVTLSFTPLRAKI
jgi:hypothetical protein